MASRLLVFSCQPGCDCQAGRLGPGVWARCPHGSEVREATPADVTDAFRAGAEASGVLRQRVSLRGLKLQGYNQCLRDLGLSAPLEAPEVASEEGRSCED